MKISILERARENDMREKERLTNANAELQA